MQGTASHSNISSWMGRIEKAFPKEVVPFIEKKFRVKSDKQHRAIAGLSMGGLHAIAISANNPSMFNYVGLFSPQSINPLTEGNIKRIQKINDHVDKVKEKLPNWWIFELSFQFIVKVLIDISIREQFFTIIHFLYYITIGNKDQLKPFLDNYRKRQIGRAHV